MDFSSFFENSQLGVKKVHAATAWPPRANRALEMKMGLGRINNSMQSQSTSGAMPNPDSFKSRPQRKRRTCEHGKFQPYCKDCKGNMLCAHLRHKNRCAVCKRSRGGNGNIVFVATTVIK